MEREVSSVARLGVMLVAIAALLSIVWVTIMMGNQISGGAYEEAAKLQANLEQTQLKSLNNKDAIAIPKAAIYNLLAQSSANIAKLEYTDDLGGVTVVTPGPDKWEATGALSGSYLAIEDVLENELIGKALIYVEKSSDESYIVQVTSIGI